MKKENSISSSKFKTDSSFPNKLESFLLTSNDKKKPAIENLAKQRRESFKHHMEANHHVTITTISNISTNNTGKERINQYQIVKKIGEGSFSRVFLCFDVNNSKNKFAMKIMDKTSLKTKMISSKETAYTQVQKEMAVMKQMDHPNVLRLFEIIDDPNEHKLYLITEFVKNGSLAGRIRKKDLSCD